MKSKILYPSSLVLMVFYCLMIISCNKDSDDPDVENPLFNASLTYGTVTDVDGNTYKTIQIGTQTWMAENLRTTRYRDGSAISYVTQDAQWAYYNTGAYCWYNNDIGKKAVYGALYNYLAIVDGRHICPAGWHIPSNAEWATLIAFLGGEAVAGGKMKEAGTSHWQSPNTGADNTSGFTALPGGGRNMAGGFAFLGTSGLWWSSATLNEYEAWSCLIDYNYSKVYNYSDFQSSGFSVRCIKD